MKIYYLNDEQREVAVRIMDTSYNPSTGSGDRYVRLKAAEGRLFDVAIPPDCVPYIKKWPNVVMISYVDPAALSQSDEQPQHAGGELKD